MRVESPQAARQSAGHHVRTEGTKARASHVARGNGRPAHEASPDDEGGANVPSVDTARSKRGVIRLLGEGHFNPVAALRHHLKFQSEIAAAGIEPFDVSSVEVSSQRGSAIAKFVDQYLKLQASDVAADVSVEGDVSVEEDVPVVDEEAPGSATDPASPETPDEISIREAV